MATAALGDLNIATQAFIQAAKLASGTQAANIRIAIVGGTAIIHTTAHRITQDVDLFISGADRIKLRNAIIARCNIPGQLPVWTVNGESVCGLTYTLRRSNHTSVHIRIDLIDEQVTGWKVSSNRVLAQLAASNMPWGSRNDLICTKLKSAFDRAQERDPKAAQDVSDVEQLLASQPGVLTDSLQKQHCLQCLSHVMHLSSWSPAVWEGQLGIRFKKG